MFWNNRNKTEYRDINEKEMLLVDNAFEDSGIIKNNTGFEVNTEHCDYIGQLNLPSDLQVYIYYIKCYREETNNEDYKVQAKALEIFENARTKLAHKHNIESSCQTNILTDTEKELIYTFYYHNEDAKGE